MSAERPDTALLQLSEAAGLAPVWQDVYGRMRHVQEPVLRSMLSTLGLSCDSPQQIAESLAQLEHEAEPGMGAMLMAQVSEPPTFRYTGSPIYTLTLEGGGQYIGRARQARQGMVSIPGVEQPGYHQLSIGDLQFVLAVAPKRCPSLSNLTGRQAARAWGVAAQVYSLRPTSALQAANGRPQAATSRSIPVLPGWATGGDFGALARLARHAAASGASAVAISPVHAMFSADPRRYSPYSPSSRLFLNAAYIDPSVAMGEEALRQAASRLDAEEADIAPGTGHIDWQQVLPRRMRLLRLLFNDFRGQSPTDLMQQFEVFRRRGGEALESHARYEALHAHHLATLGPASGWQDWPADLHDPRGTGVQAFAASHEEEIAFHVFLQWLADRGMQFAQESARDAGMSIGLIADLAIGTDPRGSHAWSRQEEILAGVSVGAPPDLFQPRGQDWGLTAFSPRALRRNAYAAFIETVRAALAHAGGVRIDHILGLARMWLIPRAAAPSDGVYLRYPMDEMLHLLTLEAWRHKALVVGENLGTVPEGFNDALQRKGILGTSVLWFERSPETVREPDSESGRELETEPKSTGTQAASAFLPPSSWSSQAMATPTTHDLPTIAGWWIGRDLEWRERISPSSGDNAAQHVDERLRDKTALWRALQDAGCVTAGAELPAAPPRNAVLSFVGGTPAPLVVVELEDLLGLEEQPNLPGGGEGNVQHPNWTQCLPVGVDEIFTDADVARSVDAIKLARRKA